jgi:predicted small metal-binding protein
MPVMSFKLDCLYGCDFVAQGESQHKVGYEVMAHLAKEHQMPADPTELADCAIPAYDDPRETRR